MGVAGSGDSRNAARAFGDAATGDPGRAAAAVQAFTRAHSITSAAGVVADTRCLLDGIASHDRFGVLAEVRAAQDL